MESKEQKHISVREQFKEQVTVNAIAKIVNADRHAECLFWTILLAGCIFLTYRDCKDPITAYLNEDGVSVVRLYVNQAIDFPGATLCVNVPISQLNSKNASRLTENATLQLYGNCLHSEECAKRREFYDDFYDEISTTIKIISSYVVAEVGRKAQINTTNAITLGIPESFYRFLLETNLGVEQLIDRMAFAVCSKMEFELEIWQETHGNKSFDFCNTAILTWLGVIPDTSNASEHFCYRVGSFTHFPDPRQWNMLSFMPDRLAPAEGKLALDAARSENYFESYLNFLNEVATTDKSTSYVTIKQQQCVEIDAAIAFRLRVPSKRQWPCSETETQMECEGHCYVESLRDACNCTSISWLKALEYDEQLVPSCFSAFPRTEFTDRAYNAKTADSARQCRHRCRTDSIPCEQTLVTISSKLCDTPELYRNGSTTIELRVRKFSYINCEESLSMELPALMSALGGVLGLWLEAGFVGLVHLLVFPIMTAAKWLLRREEKDPSTKADHTDNAEAAEDLVTTRLCAIESRQQATETLLAQLVATVQAWEERRSQPGRSANRAQTKT